MAEILEIHEFFVEGSNQERSHVLLHITEPGTPEERGLKLPSLLAPEGADATEGGPPGRH